MRSVGWVDEGLERSCAEATLRRDGRETLGGRMKVEEVRETTLSSGAPGPEASIEVRLVRSRWRVSSSGVTEKLDRTALHQASIFVPSLLKLRRRLTPGEMAELELREKVRPRGAPGDGSLDDGTVVGAEVGLGWKFHPGVAVADENCLGGAGVRKPSDAPTPKSGPAVEASKGLYSLAVSARVSIHERLERKV